MKDKIKYGIITFLYILLIIFFVVLNDLNLFLGVIILGGILGIVPLVIAIYLVYRVINRSKRLTPYSSISDFKTICSIFFLIVLSLVFILFTITSEFMAGSDPLMIAIFMIPVFSFATCISCCITAPINRFFNKKIYPKRGDIVVFSLSIKNREKIPILELQRYFQGDWLFYDKLLKWVEQFKFKIDGDSVILNNETVDDFIRMIDAQYKEWSYKEKSKIKFK